jgi:glycosyltransferase involved in cell wall biosynthesis
MTLPAAGAPQLSLLCCTVGRTEKLTRLLASLAAQTRKDFELVIVDQNPPGELDPILAPWRDKLDIRHIRSARGLSRARNVGLGACNTPLVAFPDDDCWWPAQLAERLIKLFADNPDVGLIAGRTKDAAGEDSLGLFLNADAEIDTANIWRTGNSNSIFARTQAARAINGFDEALGVGADSPFKSGEETDFVLRLLSNGVRGKYIADLVVHHDQAPQGGAAGLARAQGYAQGYGRVLRRHRFGGLFVLTRIARSSARAALNLAQGDLDGARYKALWALGTIKGYCAR